jgi:thymidylate synthase ThyX
MYVKVIASATDLHNFFALRAHKDAQPEIRVLAEKMLEQYNNSNPKFLKPGEWHLPFSAGFDQQRVQQESSIWGEPKEEIIKQICTARVARVSYLNFEGKDDYNADIKLCKKLFENVPKHSSPAESVAMALAEPTRIGNFIGFKQYRKFFKDENIQKDPRVKIV